MYRKLVLCLCVVLFSAVMATAQDVNEDKKPVDAANKDTVSEAKATKDKAAKKDVNKGKASATKELSGMSIVGNDEAPKSLYIVPWKGSEIGVETNLDMMMTEGDVPVDRDVFKRQLEFYKVSTEK